MCLEEFSTGFIMALTTNKKNKIIADHKAKRFKSNAALAKHYKVDPKTVKKITMGISQDNAQAVEAGVAYENSKKSLKNPVEIKAIETAVEERTLEQRREDAHLENLDIAELQISTKVRKDMTDNKEPTPEVLNVHARTTKNLRQSHQIKKGKEAPLIENHLNMQQLQLNQEETNIEVTVIDLESEALVKLFKDKNLPS